MAVAVFTRTMDGSTAAASLTSSIDLGVQRYDNAYLEVPTMTSNTELRLLAAATEDGTYRTVYHPTINSATSSLNIYKVSSGVSGLIPIPNGLRFIKVQSTASVSFSATFKVHTSGQ